MEISRKRNRRWWEMINIVKWFSENWTPIVPIVLSIIAILFTAFKDFIIPFILKPKLNISYDSKEPYKRSPIIINGSTISAFDRFKIENVGKETAKGCRCQIYSIEDDKGKKMDLQGFPLRWASRPDSAGDFTKAERLNISPGESEFVDLVYMRSDNTTKIFFNSYHNIPIGMPDNIPFESYLIKCIISGDNFKPQIVSFKILKKIDLNGFHIKLLEIKRK